MSGRLDAGLDEEEERHQHTGDGEEPERLHGRPADLVPVHDRVHRDHERGGHRDRARNVEASGGSKAPAAGQDDERENDDRDPDRDVHEEDPVPGERVGEDPAEQHADRAAARGDEAEHAHRLRALGGLGEERDDERERDRRDDRSAEALHRAGADQRLLRAREAAGERGGGEEHYPDDEQPPVAEEITEPAAEQQEPAEREQVGVHDPREGRLREARGPP